MKAWKHCCQDELSLHDGSFEVITQKYVLLWMHSWHLDVYIQYLWKLCGWPHASVSLWEVNPLRICMTLISSSGNPGATVVMSEHDLWKEEIFYRWTHMHVFANMCVQRVCSLPVNTWVCLSCNLNRLEPSLYTHTHPHTHWCLNCIWYYEKCTVFLSNCYFGLKRL